MAEWEIPFNRTSLVGNELSYLERAARGEERVGGGSFTTAAQDLLASSIGCVQAMLTTSCTAALELSALLLDLTPDDSVIVPSFTFVTSALAFARTGAKLRFADIEADTLGIDPESVAALLDDSVRAVVPIHYAGVGCDIDGVYDAIAGRDVSVVADNAHGLFGSLGGRALSSLGRFATLSFHHTKSFTCGEGGALILNDAADVERARILYEKGTNRQAFLAGAVANYSWIDTGSSFALSELLAAHLLGQLEQRDRVLRRRRHLADRYDRLLRPFEDRLGFRVMRTPAGREVADHMFYVLLEDRERRDHALHSLWNVGVQATSHYVPLHDSVGAARYLDQRVGPPQCPRSTDISGRILRLPFFNELTDAEVDRVVEELVKILGR